MVYIHSIMIFDFLYGLTFWQTIPVDLMWNS